MGEFPQSFVPSVVWVRTPNRHARAPLSAPATAERAPTLQLEAARFFDSGTLQLHNLRGRPRFVSRTLENISFAQLHDVRSCDCAARTRTHR